MAIKMKCNSCGKKEAQLMSKLDIKTSNFVDSTVLNTVLGMINDWTQAKYIICGACGHKENA